MSTVAHDLAGDPADGLAAAVSLRRLADRLEDAHAERALRAGWSLQEVAQALGTTDRDAGRRHSHRLGAAFGRCGRGR